MGLSSGTSEMKRHYHGSDGFTIPSAARLLASVRRQALSFAHRTIRIAFIEDEKLQTCSM
jgi:hypothetical protein